MVYTPPLDSPESFVGRRLFLSRSMAMGIAAGLGTGISTSQVMASPAMAFEAECKASPSDSLLLYLDLLLKVQTDAFTAAASGLMLASQSCEDTLRKLQEQVNILQREVQSAHTTAQAQQMRDVVELGKAHAEMIKASAGSPQRASAAVANALTVVSNHINRKAQDLLPQGDIRLSAKAKTALAEVLRLVRDFQEVPEQTRLAREEYQRRVTEIRTNIDAIRNGLFAASASAADAEMAQSASAAQEARTRASQLIDEVKGKLETLRANPGSAPAPPAATTAVVRPAAPIDLLIAVLEGTKRWIDNPQLISLLLDGNKDQPKFLPATFGASPSTVDSLYSRVKTAIHGSCPRGTDYRTLWCLNLILGPLAFPERETRIPLIAGVLLLFPCWNGNKNALVVALADV